MKVACEKCHTEYDLDTSIIKEKGSSFRCVKCKHIFKVYPPLSIRKESKNPLRTRKRVKTNLLLSLPRHLKLSERIAVPFMKWAMNFICQTNPFSHPIIKHPALYLSEMRWESLTKSDFPGNLTWTAPPELSSTVAVVQA